MIVLGCYERKIKWEKEIINIIRINWIQSKLLSYLEKDNYYFLNRTELWPAGFEG